MNRLVQTDWGCCTIGNPSVKAASVTNAEVDWDRVVPQLQSTIRMALFVQRTDNVLTNPYEADGIGDGFMTSGGEELRSVAHNVGHSTAAGGEIGLRGHAPSGLRWNISYSFESIADHLSINRAGIFSPQDFAHGTPTHSVVVGGGYSIGQWEFDAQSRWQSQYIDYRGDPTIATLLPVKVNDYFVANLRAGYRLTDNVTVALSGQQFNVSQLRVSAGPPVERRIFLSLTAHF